MYKYLPIEQAKVGSVVEAVSDSKWTTGGKHYLILPGSNNGSIGHYIDDNGNHTDGISLQSKYWKLVQQRVAIVTKDVRGHPVGSRIIPKNGEWVLADKPKGSSYLHSIGVSCEWEDTLINTGIPHTQNPCYEIPLVAERSIESQSKENTMNSLQELLLSLFGNEKPTTDYDKRPAFLVTVYSIDGTKVATATAPSLEMVKDKVRNTPSLWGCKVLTYKLDKEVSVTVPVTATKATTAAEVEATPAEAE